jgi:hypothetical protein
MTLDEQLQELYFSGDAGLQDLATRAGALKNAFLSQQLSQSEYSEMINDLAREKNINESAHSLEVKETVNATLNALVAVAGAV